MSKIKVSVIVPIYKTEKYLSTCVESLLCQTLKEIEIILIDDGSPDNCPALCDNYALKDSRIKVIHKTNSGLSDARNIGIKEAAGEYIGFVDSDDWVKPEMFEKMYQNAIQNNADVVVCNLFVCEQGKQMIKKTYWSNVKQGIVSKKKIYRNIFVEPCYIWNKIYKKTFLNENKLYFIKGYIYEDVPFFTQVMLLAKSVSYCPLYLYFYRIGRNDSLSRGKSEKQLDIIDIAQITQNILKNLKAPQSVYENFKKWQIQIYVWMYNLLPDNQKEKALAKIKKKHLIQQIMRNISKSKVKILFLGKFKILRFKTKRFEKIEKIVKLFSPIITIKKI